MSTARDTRHNGYMTGTAESALTSRAARILGSRACISSTNPCASSGFTEPLSYSDRHTLMNALSTNCG